MKTTLRVLAAATLAAGLAACASNRADMAQSSTPVPATVSSSQMRMFTDAARQVSAIDSQYATRMQSVDPMQREMLDREANGEKARAVNSAGLSVIEYNAIAMAVRDDPTLMRQYSEMSYQGMSGQGMPQQGMPQQGMPQGRPRY
ncbi:hypothetical protein GCM10023144_42530 [Pigmentiphaga soli]|uniref:DUF4168 domain-containing protein n=1 Tax=Pigmentiphaga soli TaxID=1007095 RepID=A0ABP8HMY3_9BURK